LPDREIIHDEAAGSRADHGVPRGSAAAAFAGSSEHRKESVKETTIQAAGSSGSAVWQRL